MARSSGPVGAMGKSIAQPHLRLAEPSGEGWKQQNQL
jgi:hypothetical protein